MANPAVSERLRDLPSVEELATASGVGSHQLAVAAAREEIAALRRSILGGGDPDLSADRLASAVNDRAGRIAAGSLRRVVNATGVVLHTNLGRAPLAAEAAASAAALATGYSNLELDLETGERGSRHSHVEGLLVGLSGAAAAIAVNNNAAAVLLALAATAAGREVIVSRGELIEIGGSFRIPEILGQSGARLVEVGTTNRTRLADYEQAIGPDTAAILRVHQSNFRTVGFTEAVPARQLATVAHEHGLALIDDLGSGALEPIGDEPPLAAAVAAGADLVCCSADKLLGGPQAGILVGAAQAVAACRTHPLARALRLDRLQLGALEATLRLHRDGQADAIPTLAMLAAGEDELADRAARLAEAIGEPALVERAAAKPGGGSLPLTELAGPVCVLEPGPGGAEELMARLRGADPPVIARIASGKVVLDVRTIAEDEIEAAAASVRWAVG
jgi:L-seryl-tRNA(Ser) seleniumtransferase